MDKIKEAFDRVRNDINSSKENILSITNELSILKKEISNICDILTRISGEVKKLNAKQQSPTSTQDPINKTEQHKIPTHRHTLEAQKSQNIDISIGNGGVPTDRQTDRQTDNKHQNIPNNQQETYKKQEKTQSPSEVDNAVEILNSLNSLKKEIRLKFKRLTDQEMIVFSTLYQLDEEYGYSEYKTISKKLNLTESSIRDYVGRLIKKGIPVVKTKINNKIIHLSISENLKKIAPLPTILQLRDL